MSEQEAVKVWFACGAGMCDMDTASAGEEGPRIFAGGAEGLLKVSNEDHHALHCICASLESNSATPPPFFEKISAG